MGRRKFQDGDLCKLDDDAPDRLMRRFSDTVFRVTGYDRSRYSGSNKYVVQPVKEDTGKHQKIRPSYLKEYNGNVSNEDDRLDAQFQLMKERIETLQHQKRTLKKERDRLSNKIDFRERWGLEEFDETLWCASKIFDIIESDDRSRKEKIKSISSIIQACKV